MRRFTRLTNGFSKKLENLRHAVSLHYMVYNFARIHKTLRISPTQSAGITDKLWEIEDIVSGFANSSGGLIIWGVDGRKNADGIDCAVSRIPIDPVNQFVSRLNELTGEAVSPMSEGIRHKAIIVAGSAGLAMSYIPESDSGPHMAKLGEDRYYKRSGDSFYRMEHFDLEDMFGRRKKPKLVLSTRVTGSGFSLTIYVGIRNEGRGTAKAPYLAFQCPRRFRLSPYGQDGLPRLRTTDRAFPNRYGGNSNFVIHPGTELEITSIWLGNPPHTEPVPPHGDVVIEYEVTAEDARPERAIAIVNVG